MSKRAPGRSRIENDFYPTQPKAVEPLLPFLRPGARFFEPCAGNGALIEAFARRGIFCVGACDIEPRVAENIFGNSIERGDALKLRTCDVADAELIISNPPFERDVMHPLIEHFRLLKPSWVLVESDWLLTAQAVPLLRYASDIVVIGRMKLIPHSSSAGFDNYAWVQFQSERCETAFHNPVEAWPSLMKKRAASPSRFPLTST